MSYRRVQSFQAKANAQRTKGARFADWMTSRFGSMWFFSANAFFFIGWMIWNTGWVPEIIPFDPYPFTFLTMIVSLEAIFLSIIVLISQNRAAHIADVREEIDLQLDVITEEEVTKVMELVVYLAKHQGYAVDKDKTLPKMLKQLDVNKISQLLEKQLQ
jgi:uncharacterized membrane protein